MNKGVKTTCFKCGRIYYELPKERDKPFFKVVDEIKFEWIDKNINNKPIEINEKKCSNCGRQFYKKKNDDKYEQFIIMSDDIKISSFSK